MTKKKIFPLKLVRSIPKEILTCPERVTLMYLLDYIDCPDGVYLSAARIGEEANLGTSTVHNAFTKLKAMGLIVITKRRHGSHYRYYKNFDLGKIEALTKKSQPNRFVGHEHSTESQTGGYDINLDNLDL